MSRQSPIQTVQPIPDISEAIMQFARQQPDSLDTILISPAVSLVIFNKLSRLAKHYILRLLTLTNENQPLPEQTISGWSLNSALKEHERAMESLEKTFLIIKRQNAGHMQQAVFNLRESFRKGMQIVMSRGPDSLSTNGDDMLNEEQKVTVRKLSNDIWNDLLTALMVERMGNYATEAVSRNWPMLIESGLLHRAKRQEDQKITGVGFNFLLANRSKQVWFLIESKIKTSFNLQQRCFLAQLAYTKPFHAYKSQGLDENELYILKELQDLGLVHMEEELGLFYPTELISGILYSGSVNSDLDDEVEESDDLIETDEKSTGIFKADHSKRYLILETNYRLYAYTDSELQINTLQYFAKILYKLPGMAVLTITRHTIQEACQRGITSEMIIDYVRSHSHEVQKNSKVPGLGGTGARHILPPVVTDSIRIWALERDRTKPQDCIVYSEFDSPQMFKNLKKRAVELGVFLYGCEKDFKLVIHESAHREMKKAYKQFKKSQN